MDILRQIVFFSDRIVDLLQSRLRLPWDDINSYLTDLIPNDGMAFPYMAGRLAWWGLIAGILLTFLSKFSRKGRVRKSFKEIVSGIPMAVLVAGCTWGLYAAFRDVFFLGEDSFIKNKYIVEIPQMFARAFRGEMVLDSVLRILLGIVAIVLILVLFGVFSLLPMAYYDELKEVYGKLAPLALLKNAGLTSSALSLVFLGLYYVIVNGGAVFALKVWIAMLIIAAGWRFISVFLLAGLEFIGAAIFSFFGDK